MRSWVGFLFIASLSAQELPTVTYWDDDGKVPRDHPVDMERMKLELTFDPTQGLVRGKATHVFRSLWDEVGGMYFDGVNLRILEVTLNEKPVPYVASDRGLTVLPQTPLQAGSRDSIGIRYEARPRSGLHFVGWNSKGPIRKQIWTQGQDIEHRHWIPMYDAQNDKMLTEMIITFDPAYTVISNGKKIGEKTNKDGTKTWHYRNGFPHASYLLMLAIGEYGVETVKTKRGFPIQLYYYPDEKSSVGSTYRFTTQVVDFLEKEIGVPFPWESLSNIPAQDFVTGAMENTTAILFGDFWFVSPRAALDEVYWDTDAHEIAHQWFGDLVTGRTTRHLWLQESFATYYAKLFVREVAGEDAYEWERRQEHRTAMEADQANPVPIVHSGGDYARLYPKGSAVLDMMAYQLGRPSLRRVIQFYLNRHRYRNVETNDLYLAFEDTLGISPFRFFDQWLYRGGFPSLDVQVRDLRVEGGDRQTEIEVRQIHTRDHLTGLFEIPMDVEVWYTDGSIDSQRVTISAESERIVFPNTEDKTVDFVLVDPGSQILKEMTFLKDWRELQAQASKARHMIDRYDAILAMRPFPVDEKREFLKQAFARETFHAVRSEIVRQLAYDLPSRDIVKAAIGDTNADVRSGVAFGYSQVPADLEPDFRSLLHDSSYTVSEQALKILCESFPAHANAYLEMTKGEMGFRFSSHINWLNLKASFGDTASALALVRYAGPDHEFRARRSAMAALQELNFWNDAAISHLCDGILSTNGNLSSSARSVAAHFYSQTAFRRAVEKFLRSRKWEDWQLSILSEVFS